MTQSRDLTVDHLEKSKKELEKIKKKIFLAIEKDDLDLFLELKKSYEDQIEKFKLDAKNITNDFNTRFNQSKFFFILDSNHNNLLQQAAYYGSEKIFTYIKQNHKPQFNELIKKENNQHQTLLHLAVLYDESHTSQQIKNKKKIIWHIYPEFCKRSHLNTQDMNGNTALHLAAHYGCIETATSLLKANRQKVLTIEEENSKENNKDNKAAFGSLFSPIAKRHSTIDFDKVNNQGRTAEELAAYKGHQFIYDAIQTLKPNKKKKVKTDKQIKNQTNKKNSNDETLLYLARNPNIENEKLIEAMKNAELTSLQLEDIIEQRQKALERKHFARDIVESFISTICPSATVAGFVALFAAIELPVAIVIGLALFIPFAILTFYRVKERKHEYGHLMQETLRLSYLAERMKNKENQYSQKLDDLIKKTNEGIKNFHSDPSATISSLNQIKNQRASLYQEIQKDQYVDFNLASRKKPKIRLQYMHQDQVKEKKYLGRLDSNENADLVRQRPTIKGISNAIADFLCPFGAVFALLGVGGLAFKVCEGLGFLALGAALGTPIGLGIFVTAMIILAIGVGVAVYKTTYAKHKEEAGARNREFLDAYHRCKNQADFTQVKNKILDLNAQIKTLEEKIASVPQANSDANLSNKPSQAVLIPEKKQSKKEKEKKCLPIKMLDNISFKNSFTKFSPPLGDACKSLETENESQISGSPYLTG